MKKKKIGGLEFEIFTPTPRGKKSKPEITITYKNSQIRLSKAASSFLDKEYAAVGYDAKQKAIAIQPCRKSKSCIKISEIKKGCAAGTKYLCSKMFCNFIKSIVGEKKKFPCEWNEKEKALIFYL